MFPISDFGKNKVIRTDADGKLFGGTVAEVPSGGTTGYYLKKTATGYAWAALPVETKLYKHTLVGKDANSVDQTIVFISSVATPVDVTETTPFAVVCAAGAFVSGYVTAGAKTGPVLSFSGKIANIVDITASPVAFGVSVEFSTATDTVTAI